MIRVKSVKLLLSLKSKIMMPDCNSAKNNASSKSKVYIFSRPRYLNITEARKISEDDQQFI